MFYIWDDVNERAVVNLWDQVEWIEDGAVATEYAKRLNECGGYGGWASLRFHVRSI